jgi:nucleoside-diphosphate-sugar epimerase
MRVLVLGCGLVGTALAAELRALGHHVVGTTTTEAKVDGLMQVCDDVAVLKGSDRAAVHAAVDGCDAVVVCAGPGFESNRSPEDRARTYTDVLVRTAENVVSAPGEPYLVMLSSLSVYGDASNHLPVITEDSPLTTSDDPSPVSFIAAERTYLDGAGDRACVLRCAEIFGAGDPPIEAKVAMAHQILGGTLPFAADALFYRVSVEDTVAAIVHAVTHRITGPFNLTHAEVPGTDQEVFDAIGAAQGFGPLEFRAEIASPSKPISVERLAATGFSVTKTPATRAPQAGAAV